MYSRCNQAYSPHQLISVDDQHRIVLSLLRWMSTGLCVTFLWIEPISRIVMHYLNTSLTAGAYRMINWPRSGLRKKLAVTETETERRWPNDLRRAR